MPMQVFNPFGSITKSPLRWQDSTGKQVANVAYITIAEAGGDNIVLGYAPITGVDIKQLTDFSVTKSLDRDFLIATFGDTPVQITLKGLNFFNLNGCTLLGNSASNDQIMEFYKKNRLSTDRFKRFDIAIAISTNNTVVFRCVIVGLDTQNTASQDGLSNMLYSYTMTLIGVDRE